MQLNPRRYLGQKKIQGVISPQGRDTPHPFIDRSAPITTTTPENCSIYAKPTAGTGVNKLEAEPHFLRPPALDTFVYLLRGLRVQYSIEEADSPMACAWRLPSSASSFHGHVLAPAASPSVLAPWGSQRNGGGAVSVRASDGIALVEKSDAEKVNRLKATYLEKIVPLLKEEFSYTNIHQVIGRPADHAY